MQDMHLAARLAPEQPAVRPNRPMHLLNAPLFRAAPVLLWIIPAITIMLLLSLGYSGVLRAVRALRGAVGGRRRSAAPLTPSQRRRELAARLRSLRDGESTMAAVRGLQDALAEADDLCMASDPPARAARERLRRLLSSRSLSSGSSGRRRGGKMDAAAAAAVAAVPVSDTTQPASAPRKRRGKGKSSSARSGGNAAPAQSPAQPPSAPPDKAPGRRARAAQPSATAVACPTLSLERPRTCADALCPCNAARSSSGGGDGRASHVCLHRDWPDGMRSGRHTPRGTPRATALKPMHSPAQSPHHPPAPDGPYPDQGEESADSSRSSSQAERQPHRSSCSDAAAAPGTPPPQPPSAITFAPRPTPHPPAAPEPSAPAAPPAFSPTAATAPPFVPAGHRPWPMPSAFLHTADDGPPIRHPGSPQAPAQRSASFASVAAAPSGMPLPGSLQAHVSEILSASASQASPLAACASTSSLNHNARSFIPAASGHFSSSPRASAAAEALRRALTAHDLARTHSASGGSPGLHSIATCRTEQMLGGGDWLAPVPRTYSASTPLPAAQMQEALDRFAAVCNLPPGEAAPEAAALVRASSPGAHAGGLQTATSGWGGLAADGGPARQGLVLRPLELPLHASPPDTRRSPLQNYSMWTGSTIW